MSSNKIKPISLKLFRLCLSFERVLAVPKAKHPGTRPSLSSVYACFVQHLVSVTFIKYTIHFEDVLNCFRLTAGVSYFPASWSTQPETLPGWWSLEYKVILLWKSSTNDKHKAYSVFLETGHWNINSSLIAKDNFYKPFDDQIFGPDSPISQTNKPEAVKPDNITHIN